MVFYPGYAPVDGDRITWLSAGGSVSGADQLALGVAGLSGFSVTAISGASSASFEITDDSALPLPTSGGYSVLAGGTVYNNLALTSSGNYTGLSQIDNAGTFSNRTDAYVYAQQFNNLDGGVLRNRGVANFDNLNNRGSVLNLTGATLTVSNFNNSGTLSNDGDVTVYNTLSNQSLGRIENRGTLATRSVFNQGDFIVSGSHIFNGAFTNNGGSVSIAVGGQSVKDPGALYAEYRQAGGTTRVDGLLAADLMDFSFGTLTGSGTLQGTVALHSNMLDLGNSPGTLTIDGSLAIDGSKVRIALAGPGASSLLTVTGSVNFASSQIEFVLVGGYRPAFGDSFAWLSSPSAPAGLGTGDWIVSFDTAEGGGTYAIGGTVVDPNAPVGMLVTVDGTSISFTQAVPEPDGWALMLGGLTLVAWLARRKSAVRQQRAGLIGA
jgi:hypothetical protein